MDERGRSNRQHEMVCVCGKPMSHVHRGRGNPRLVENHCSETTDAPSTVGNKRKGGDGAALDKNDSPRCSHSSPKKRSWHGVARSVGVRDAQNVTDFVKHMTPSKRKRSEKRW